MHTHEKMIINSGLEAQISCYFFLFFEIQHNPQGKIVCLQLYLLFLSYCIQLSAHGTHCTYVFQTETFDLTHRVLTFWIRMSPLTKMEQYIGIATSNSDLRESISQRDALIL